LLTSLADDKRRATSGQTAITRVQPWRHIKPSRGVKRREAMSKYLLETIATD